MSKKTHQMTKCQKRPYLGRYVRRQVDLKRTIICHVNKERSGTWHSRTFCPSVVDDTENPSSEMTQREPPSLLSERDDLSDRSSLSFHLSQVWHVSPVRESCQRDGRSHLSDGGSRSERRRFPERERWNDREMERWNEREMERSIFLSLSERWSFWQITLRQKRPITCQKRLFMSLFSHVDCSCLSILSVVPSLSLSVRKMIFLTDHFMSKETLPG